MAATWETRVFVTRLGRKLVRPAGLLTQQWFDFQASCPDQDEVSRLRVVQCRGVFYFLDRATCLWKASTVQDLAAIHATRAMATLASGGFMRLVNDKERHYLGSMRGATAVFRHMIPCIQDADFEKRLDDDLELLPFANGVLDLRTGVFRPRRWDDYCTRHTGYDYAKPSEEQRAFVKRFFEQILPVPEERELFLRTIGIALSGQPASKKFLVLQDARDFDSGKSTAVRACEAALGEFVTANAPWVLYARPRATKANAGDGDLLYYAKKRIAVFDELIISSVNATHIKTLTDDTARRNIWKFNANAKKMNISMTEFRWTPLVLVALNKGSLSGVDLTDVEFIERMVPIPFRAKFNTAAAAAGAPLALPNDLSMSTKLSEARMAVMEALLEARARHEADPTAFDRLPQGCMDLRRAMIGV